MSRRRQGRVPGTTRPRRPATIVDWIVDWIADRQPPAPMRLADMSEPSKTWVDRMWHAMINPDVTESSFDELDEAFIAYLDRLDDDERLEAEGTHMLLATMLSEHYDELCCPNCGRLKCPHCELHAKDSAAS